MGELRANLFMPSGTATITYDTANQIGQLQTVAANISVSLSGLTGPILQAHVHGPAFFGSNGGVLSALCNAETPCSALASGVFSQTFANVLIPTALWEAGSAYINLHTAANPSGEARGQLSRVARPSISDGPNVGSVSLEVLQESTAVQLNLMASSSQNVGANIQTPASAAFSMTFSPSSSSIAISNITIQNLRSQLTAIHIHGPCEASFGCNTDVVFTICGMGSKPCPSIMTGSVDASSASGTLYHSILGGRGFYYVNIHTVT